MSKRGDLELLLDMKEAIQRINDYIKDVSHERFFKDHKTQDAVVRNLEIIGEAAKNLSSELKKKHPSVPWKELAGVRDRLIHHYFGVSFDIVWHIVKKELPPLLIEIKKLSKNHKK